VTEYGPVIGLDDGAGTWSWKGIPFAKAPAGPFRWRSPQPPEPWTSPREATAFGPAAPQLGYLHGPGLNNTFDGTVLASLGQPLGSEDCLHLNLWRPATEEAGLPVIFFIFGGAKVSGYPADPLYDGAALARKANAVVVTVNYRLGVLGWLDLPQLKSGEDPQEDSGNFGTLDQIAALRFVQRNIAGFGGDPGCVTVLGHSAGAADVCALLTSPTVVEVRPQLLHRAILLSGGLALPEELPPGSIPILRSAAYTRMQGSALLHALLAADGLAADGAAAAAFLAAQPESWAADYLRAKPAEELLTTAFSRLLPAGLGQISHIPDGRVVADTPLAAIRAGRYLQVPVLLSTTRDEGKLFPGFLALSPALGGHPGLAVSDARRLELMMSFEEGNPQGLSAADLVHPAYLPAEAPGTGYEARMALLTTLFFTTNRNALLEALTTRQRDIWCCRFDWDEEPAPWNTVYGAAHLFDVPFLFGNFGPSLVSRLLASRANACGRLALSEAMMGAVAAFAWTGHPGHEGLGTPWPVWPATLRFDAGPGSTQITLAEG
jgi:para-nitrobenzyl esterase